MTEPAVTVVIPVGPGHAHYLPDVLRSLAWQTMPAWEAVVVNDSGKDLTVNTSPEVTMLATAGREGVSVARNLGIKAARAPWLVTLDADDLLMPRALEHLLRTAAERDACYVYSGWYNLWPDGRWSYAAPPSYRREWLLNGSLHPVTALYPTESVRAIGGFDPSWPGYEDWEFQLRLAHYGICGVTTPQPTLVYRSASGQMREFSKSINKELRERAMLRYGAYRRGEAIFMACSGCGGRAKVAAAAAVDDLPVTLGATVASPDARVRMEYTKGEGFSGSFQNPFGGSGESYRVGPGARRFISAHPLDAAWLGERGFTTLRAAPIDALPSGIKPVLTDTPPAPIVVNGELPKIAPHDLEADPDEAPTPRRKRAAS